MREMTESELPCHTLISAQCALLGVIIPKIRAVSIEWDGFKSVRLRAHYAAPPTEEEREDMEVVGTEIISDVPFRWLNPVEFIVTEDPIDKLQFLNRLVYLRKEYPTTS